MAVESATYINQLDATKPGASDLKSEGDDHLRLVKSAVKSTFPNVTGAVTGTHADLNVLTGAATGAVSGLNVTTQAASDNTTKAASTAMVQLAIMASSGLLGQLPGQSGNAGKFLKTNGSVASWSDDSRIKIAPTAGGTLTDANSYYSFISSASYTLPDFTNLDSFGLLFPSNATAVPASLTTSDGWSFTTGAVAGTLRVMQPLNTTTAHGVWGSGITMTPPTLATATVAATFGAVLGTAQLDTNLVIVVYRNASTVYAVACDTSTNTFGAPVTMMAYQNATGFGVWSDSTTSFVVACNTGGSTSSVQAGSVSGTTISLGTAVALGQDIANSIKLNNGLYVANTNQATGLIAISVSGTTVTAGTAVSAAAAGTGLGWTFINRSSNTQFLLAVLAAGGGANTRALTVCIGSVSGTTITLNATSAGTNIEANGGLNVLTDFSEGASYIAVCSNGATPTSGDWYGISVSGTTATLGTVTTRATDLPVAFDKSRFIYKTAKPLIKYNTTTMLFGHKAAGPYAVTISGTTLTFGTSGGPATTVNFLNDFTGSNFYAVASAFDKLSVTGTTVTSSFQVAAVPTLIMSDTLTNAAVNYGGTWYTWTMPTMITALTSSKWLRSTGSTNLTLSGPIA
jgi:hypothetical protein